MSANRLALGTAQFGQAYGIANTTGQVPPDTAEEITNLARNSEIDTLDTAVAYGDSESRLGAVGVRDFKIVTKLPPIPMECGNAQHWVEQLVQQSCERLQVDSLYALLLHRSEDLIGPHRRAVADAFLKLKRDGVVKKTGVSIYSPAELSSTDSFECIDLVQAPLNLVDRRLVNTGWLDRLHDMGIEMHARSAFLQGLLLMPPASVPGNFSRWSKLFGRWHDFLRESGLAPGLVCLSYPLSLPKISRIVVGVDNAAQLADLVAFANSSVESARWPDIGSLDEDLINPSRWSLN